MEIDDIKDLWKTKTIDEIFVSLSKEMLKNNYRGYYCDKQTFGGLYRGRKHNNILGSFREGKLYPFENENEFWNKPKSNVDAYGRCNDLQQSLFYCSNEFEVIFAELRPKAKDFITIANFKNIIYDDSKGRKYGLRIKPIGIEYLRKQDIKSCIDKIVAESRTDELIKFDNILDELFHEIVPIEEQDKYKTTIAVSKIMLTDLIYPKGMRKEMHGIIYSSIARKMNGINIVLKPKTANNYFYIENIQTFEVLEANDNTYKIKKVRSGSTVNMKNHPTCPRMNIVWKDIHPTEQPIDITI